MVKGCRIVLPYAKATRFHLHCLKHLVGIFWDSEIKELKLKPLNHSDVRFAFKHILRVFVARYDLRYHTQSTRKFIAGIKLTGLKLLHQQPFGLLYALI